MGRHDRARVTAPARAGSARRASTAGDGQAQIFRLVAALGTLLFGLTVVVREYAPHVRRHISSTASALKLIGRAYASEAKRAWRAEQDAIAAWRESRREVDDGPGDDGPLARAGADEVDARPRDTARRR